MFKNPLTSLFRLNYRYSGPQHGYSNPILNKPASEVQAKDKLEALLQETCPDGKRLLITGSQTEGQEFLVVDPKIAKKLDKTRPSPESPIPELNADIFIPRLQKELKHAREIEIEHQDGHLVNSKKIATELKPIQQTLHNHDIKETSQSHKKTASLKSAEKARVKNQEPEEELIFQLDDL